MDDAVGGDSDPASQRRLDAELVTRGLARSRGAARELVVGGRVRVSGVVVTKPAHPVVSGDVLVVDAADTWVGRAAYKLVAALDTFGPAGLAVEGRRCVDVGASTGGFTQVLLAHGAQHVVALDVGHDQLAAPVRDDPRVTDVSGTTVRDVDVRGLGGPFDLVVGDLSFISLTLVLPDVARLVAPGGDIVLLIKPQFEVGRARLGKRGVVTDPRHRLDAVRDVIAAARRTGLSAHAIAPSPLPGGTGNREYLGWFRPGGDAPDPADVDRTLTRIIREEQA